MMALQQGGPEDLAGSGASGDVRVIQLGAGKQQEADFVIYKIIALCRDHLSLHRAMRAHANNEDVRKLYALVSESRNLFRDVLDQAVRGRGFLAFGYEEAFEFLRRPENQDMQGALVQYRSNTDAPYFYGMLDLFVRDRHFKMAWEREDTKARELFRTQVQQNYADEGNSEEGSEEKIVFIHAEASRAYKHYMTVMFPEQGTDSPTPRAIVQAFLGLEYTCYTVPARNSATTFVVSTKALLLACAHPDESRWQVALAEMCRQAQATDYDDFIDAILQAPRAVEEARRKEAFALNMAIWLMNKSDERGSGDSRTRETAQNWLCGATDQVTVESLDLHRLVHMALALQAAPGAIQLHVPPVHLAASMKYKTLVNWRRFRGWWTRHASDSSRLAQKTRWCAAWAIAASVAGVAVAHFFVVHGMLSSLAFSAADKRWVVPGSRGVLAFTPLTSAEKLWATVCIFLTHLAPTFLQSVFLHGAVVFNHDFNLADFLLQLVLMGLNVVAIGLAFVAGTSYTQAASQGILDNLKCWLFGHGPSVGPTLATLWQDYGLRTLGTTFSRIWGTLVTVGNAAVIPASKVLLSAFVLWQMAQCLWQRKISDGMQTLVGALCSAVMFELVLLVGTQTFTTSWDDSQDVKAMICAAAALAGHGYVTYFVASSVRGAVSSLGWFRPRNMPIGAWAPEPFRKSILTSWPLQAAAYLLLFMWFVTVYQTGFIANFRVGLANTAHEGSVCAQGNCTSTLTEYMRMFRETRQYRYR